MVPQLRFKDEAGCEFDEWEEVELGDVFQGAKGVGLSKDKITEDGQNECILYGELYTKYNEVIYEVSSRTNDDDGLKSKDGDLLIPSSTTTTGVDLANITALNKDDVLLGGDITVLRSNFKTNNIFYAYYLSNNKKREIASYAQGGTIVHLYYNHIKHMLIALPSIQEQTKIADFLTSVDKKIDLLAKKKESLDLYKKGLMQKIFSQELRFKDEAGGEFDEWEEVELGDVSTIKKGEQLNTSEFDIDGTIPVLNGGRYFSGFTNEANQSGNTITISEGGNSCGFVNFIKEDFFAGGHCYVVMPKKQELTQFLFQSLKMLELNVMKLGVGGGIKNIQKKDIDSFKIALPSIQEQTKIAEFLTSVDKKIDITAKQLESAKTFKKCLMQQMFA